jgi:trehalose 6-phosphate phosphatase
VTPDDLRALAGAAPDRTALLFDFDGTLSPLVADPGSASAVDGAVDLLDRLAARFRTVAVVSGRPRAFIADRLGPAVDLSGLYGLETRTAGIDAEHAEAGRWRPVIAGVADSAADELPAGVTVEPKGLSLTVHYRRVPEAEAAVHDWAAGAAADTGLELRPAKASVELHPPIEVDKGTSVRALSDGCDVAVYVGDDVGDLPAFAALDALRAEGMTTVKVVAGGDELPDAVAQAADLVVDGPEAVVALFGPLA